MKTSLLIVVAVLISLMSARANEVSINAGHNGSSNDLFQAATVTASLGIANVTDPQAAFGLVPDAYERGTVIANNNTTGRIEFDPGMVAVKEIIVTLQSDGETMHRASNAVRLYADIGAGRELVAEAALSAPYHEYYGSYIIHAIITLDTVVTSDTWAVEWDSIAGYRGARIQEVDAFGEPPEAPSVMICPAVEIGYTTIPGVIYTVQYSTNLVSSNWFDLGTTVTGDGSTNYVFGTTRETSERYYRVIAE